MYLKRWLEDKLKDYLDIRECHEFIAYLCGYDENIRSWGNKTLNFNIESTYIVRLPFLQIIDDATELVFTPRIYVQVRLPSILNKLAEKEAKNWYVRTEELLFTDNE